MGSRSIVYVGIYALIYQHTILGEGIVSRDGLPHGVLPSGILKMRKKCLGLKVWFPFSTTKWGHSCNIYKYIFLLAILYVVDYCMSETV